MIDLPFAVRQALGLLQAAGYEAFLVGGAVRDSLRGKDAAKDWDITTSALPEQTKAVFAGFRLIETGLQHGTVTVLVEGEPLEITTYRVDGTYTDHRRPDSVTFTRSLREDLARRDFTINALAYHPDVGVVDYFGGRQDLADGIVRCVGEPERRFEEDALRILRALRFASVHGMTVEPQTAAAVHRCRHLLERVAAERVQSELTKLLAGPGAREILLEFADVLAVVIPELAPTFGFAQCNAHHDKDVWAHTAAVVQAAPPQPVVRWAALLHDIGKPGSFTVDEAGVGHFYGHPQRSAQLADAILRRLKFDTASREQIVTLVQAHDQPILPERRCLKRLLNRLGGAEPLRRLLALHRADTLGQSALSQPRLQQYEQAEQLLDELLQQALCVNLSDLAVNGRDLLALGLRGRQIGAALEAALQAVIEEQLPNERQPLLEFIRAGEWCNTGAQ